MEGTGQALGRLGFALKKLCDLRSSLVLSGPYVCRAGFDRRPSGPWTMTG